MTGDRRHERGAVSGIDERDHACGDLGHRGRGIGAQPRPGVASARRDIRASGGCARGAEVVRGGGDLDGHAGPGEVGLDRQAW